MSLPIFQLPQGPFTFSNGTNITIRGLSRGEAIEVRMAIPDAREVEILAISFSTGTSREETEKWYDSTPTQEIDSLVKAITKLSGLDEEMGKDDAGASPSEKSTA